MGNVCSADLLVLNISGILGSQPTDRGPIEILAALGEHSQESIVQQASERHGYAQALGRGQRETDVLVSERRRKRRGFKLALRDEGSAGLVRRDVEHGRSEELDVRARVDTGLADERHGLTQRLDGGGQQKVA